jgi:hypothetical protein
MTTALSTFNQHNFNKGDKVFLFSIWNRFEDPTIQYFIQEYTIHSIGKKQCYLIIGDDVMSKRTFYCEYPYGIATTKEQATELCAQLMEEQIAQEISIYEWRKNNWNNYSEIANRIILNCKTANREMLFNPFNN